MSNGTDIDNQQTFGQITAPPNFITQFYQGGLPGVPGLVPMANQFFLNQLYSMAEGKTPFDYGSRIAGFTPAEQAAMGMTFDNLGSYAPFYGAAQDIYGQSYADLLRTGALGEGMIGTGADKFSQFTDIATGLYGMAPGAAEAGTAAGVGAVTSGMEGSLAGLGAFDPANIDAFMNPFEDQVVQKALQDLEEQGAQTEAQAQAQALASGAFGGSRARLGSAEREEALREAQTSTAGRLRQSGFDRAMQQAIATDEAAKRRALQQAGLMDRFGRSLAGFGTNLAGVYGNVAGGLGGLGANYGQIMGGLGTDLAGIGQRGAQIGAGLGSNFANLGSNLYGLQGQDAARLMGIGQMQRGMDQARLNEAYSDFVGKYNMPMNMLGNYANLMGGIAPYAGTYTRGYSSPGDVGGGGFLSNLGDLSQFYGMFNSGQQA